MVIMAKQFNFLFHQARGHFSKKYNLCPHVQLQTVALAAGDSLIHLYADDTILYTYGPSLDTVLTNLQTSFNAIQLS